MIFMTHSKQTYFPRPDLDGDALLAACPDTAHLAYMTPDEAARYVDDLEARTAAQPWYQKLLDEGVGSVPLGSRWD